MSDAVDVKVVTRNPMLYFLRSNQTQDYLETISNFPSEGRTEESLPIEGEVGKGALSQREIGKRMHEVLSRIDDVSQIDEVLNEARQEGIIGEGEDWESITTGQGNSQLLNRATQGLYPPGSTFKIITALEYYRENPGKWNDYSFTCNGSITHEDYRVSCIYGTVHGDLDLESSFARSCNSSFVNIGLSLDRDKWESTMNNLYFNRTIPTDMLAKSSSVYIGAGSTDYDIMQTSIGQGRTVMTPLHLNMITQAIANDGVMMKPYIIDEITDEHGNIIKDYQHRVSEE